MVCNLSIWFLYLDGTPKLFWSEFKAATLLGVTTETLDHLAILEKIGSINSSVEHAHDRIDRLEHGIRDDLRDLKVDLKELNAHMNRAKGWSAAAVLLSGAMGGALVKLLSQILK